MPSPIIKIEISHLAGETWCQAVSHSAIAANPQHYFSASIDSNE
jgi:hypothetical protein